MLLVLYRIYLMDRVFFSDVRENRRFGRRCKTPCSLKKHSFLESTIIHNLYVSDLNIYIIFMNFYGIYHHTKYNWMNIIENHSPRELVWGEGLNLIL